MLELSPMISLDLDRKKQGPTALISQDKQERNGKSLMLMHRYVLALRLAGHAVIQDKPGKPSICSKTGYSAQTIYNILGRDDVCAMRDILLQGYEASFKAQLPQVLEIIERGLSGEILTEDQMKCATLWLKYNKVVPQDQPQGVNVTAEQVVFNILNQAQQRLNGKQDAA